MDWNVNWLAWGGIAYLLVIVNIIRGCRSKTKGWPALTVASMSCAIFAVIAELRMVGRWISHGDMIAVSDTVPGMIRIITIAAVIGILLNIFAALINSAEAESLTQN